MQLTESRPTRQERIAATHETAERREELVAKWVGSLSGDHLTGPPAPEDLPYLDRILADVIHVLETLDENPSHAWRRARRLADAEIREEKGE